MSSDRSSMLQQILARPIAHRGYHGKASACVENTPSAVSAAIAKGFGIEVDVQETADGEALVFHDYALERLVQGTGRVIEQTASDLTRLSMLEGGDRLWLLQDLLALTAGQVPLVIEIKSRQTRSGQPAFVKRVVDQVAAYTGPACIKSFDPDMLSIARTHNPHVLRGIVSYGFGDAEGKSHYNRMDRFILRHLLHAPRTAPHFVSYGASDLPALGPSLLKKLKGTPIMSWTVRSREMQDRLAPYVDQIVFEGFEPTLT